MKRFRLSMKSGRPKLWFARCAREMYPALQQKADTKIRFVFMPKRPRTVTAKSLNLAVFREGSRLRIPGNQDLVNAYTGYPPK